MKKIILTLSVLCMTTLVHARIGRTAWLLADDAGKAEIIKIYQAWFTDVSAVEKTAEWEEKKTTYFKIFSEAWAAEGMDCIYAGWPSKRMGSCSSPTRSNPDYQQGSCSPSEMQCQPLLFGGGLCVSVASREARNSAFSNCNNKFQQAGRNAAFVVSEVKSNNQEELLLSLLDFADQICESGVQANTGMCNRLKVQVTEVRSELESATETAVAIVNNLTSELAQVSRQPLDCGRSPSVSVIETQPLVLNTQIKLADLPLVPIISIEDDANSVVEAQVLDQVPPAAVVAEDSPSMTPFSRERPRSDCLIPLRANPAFYDSSNIGNYNIVLERPCEGGERSEAGITIDTGPNYPFVRTGNSRYSATMSRTFNFLSRDGARSQTYLGFEDKVLDSCPGRPGQPDYQDSCNVKSAMVLIPRLGIPRARQENGLIYVSLPTGEVSVFNADNYEIISGPLVAGEFDLTIDRASRSAPNIHYNGNGISITTSSRYQTLLAAQEPGVADTVFEIAQNGRTCRNIPRTRLFDSNGNILISDDAQLVQRLNQLCPARSGERPFALP